MDTGLWAPQEELVGVYWGNSRGNGLVTIGRVVRGMEGVSQNSG